MALTFLTFINLFIIYGGSFVPDHEVFSKSSSPKFINRPIMPSFSPKSSEGRLIAKTDNISDDNLTKNQKSSLVRPSKNSPLLNAVSKMGASAVPDYDVSYPTSFTWISASNDTFNTTLIEGVKQIREITMSIAFPFYDQLFSTMYITSLGWLTFDSGTINKYMNDGLYTFRNSLTGTFLPSASAEYMIAPLISGFFESVSLEDSELRVLLAMSDQMIVLTYDVDKPAFDAGNTMFQIVLMKNGTILFNYRQLGSFINESTWATSIGLNYGDGVVYTSIPLTTVEGKQNVTIRFDRNRQKRDLAVTLDHSEIYYYESNKTVQLMAYVANVGSQNMTNFTAILFVNGIVKWNVSFNGTNGDALSSLQVINHGFVLTPEFDVDKINVTLILTQLGDLNVTSRLQDDNLKNNRKEVRLFFADPNDRSLSVNAVLANSSEPLSGVRVTVEEMHGLITLEGTTMSNGTAKLNGWMIQDNLFSVSIKVNGIHPTWGTETLIRVPDLFGRIDLGNLILYFGPGRIDVSTLCDDQETPNNLGFCPLLLTVMPAEKALDLQNITVILNSRMSFTIPSYKIKFIGNETVVTGMIYSPVFKTSENIISLKAGWYGGYKTSLESKIVDGSNIHPLMKINVGTFLRYEWISFGTPDYTLNLTVVEQVDEQTMEVAFSFEPSRFRRGEDIRQGKMFVNIYNGLMTNITGAWENWEYGLFSNPVKRFFFFLSLNEFPGVVSGIEMPLYSWETNYAITRLSTSNEFGNVWVLTSQVPQEFGFAWYSNNTDVLTFLKTDYFELKLLNYSTTSPVSSENIKISTESSLFDFRIPSFTFMLATLSLLTSIVVKKAFKRRKNQCNKL